MMTLEEKKQRRKESKTKWQKGHPEYYKDHLEELKKYKKQYRKTHSEEIKKKARQYDQDHSEERKKYNKQYSKDHSKERTKHASEWRKTHPEDYKKSYAKYYKTHSKEIKERFDKWRKKNPEKIKAIHHKRRARMVGNGGSFTGGEWELLKKQYGYTCPMCERKEPEIKLTPDHIIPLSKGGINRIENIQPLCQSCNSKKNTNIFRITPDGGLMLF